MMKPDRPEIDELTSCAEALDLLEPFLDSELTPGDAARLQRHLEGCRSCAGELALAGRIQSELRALRPAAVLPFRQRDAARPARVFLVAAMLALTVGGAVVLEQMRVRPPAPASPEEIARATAEARFALAYIGKVSRHTGLDLRDDLLRRRSPERSLP